MLLASVTIVVLAFLPGAALALAVTAGHSRMRLVALTASPSITYGLIGVTVGWSGYLGATWPPLTILWVELALSAVALTVQLVLWRRRGLPGPGVRGLLERLRVHRADAASLGLAVVAALAFSWVLVGSLPSAPGWDAMNHAFMTSRVISTGSGLSSDVCVTGDIASTSSCGFYPLAPHVLWAQVVELTGARPTAVILASVWLIVPLTAVTGVFGVARAFGARPAVAGAAAFLPMLIGPLWPSLVTGRLTVLLGAALVPSVALLLWLAIRGPRAPAMVAVAATGLAGLFWTHTYDVIAAAFLLVGLLVTGLPFRSWRPWARVVSGAGLSMVLMTPGIAVVLTARSQRLVSRPTGQGLPVWRAIHHAVFPQGAPIGTLLAPATAGAESLPVPVGSVGATVSGVLTALLLLGMAASLLPRFRWARPFAVGHLGMLVVTLFVAARLGPAHDAIASLFYNDPRRARWSSALAPGPLTLAGAMAAVQTLILAVRAPGAALARRRARAEEHGLADPPRTATQEGSRPPTSDAIPPTAAPRASGPRQSLLAVAVALGLSALVLSVPETAVARDRLAARALPDNPAYARTTDWLSGRSGSVAEDFHRDFVPWMAIDAGLPLLRGIEPLAGPNEPDWRMRVQLWNTLIGARKSPTGCLVNRYDVGWVIVGEAAMPGGRRTWNIDALTESPFLRLARVDGPVRVYAVHDPCAKP